MKMKLSSLVVFIVAPPVPIVLGLDEVRNLLQQSFENIITCRIQIGSMECKSCTYCDTTDEISFAYDCGAYGESKCCFEKNDLRTCTLCQDLNGQQLCTIATCPLEEDTSLRCTCNITIGNTVCDSCKYCDHTQTTFAFNCGEYGISQCP